MWLSLVSSSGFFDSHGRHDGPLPTRGSRSEMGLFGMWVFLISLAALFTPALILYLILRAQAGRWPPEGMPALPNALWLSTVMLVGTSAALHVGLHSVRHDGLVALRRALLASGVLAVGFLMCQVYCWAEFFQHSFGPNWRYAGFFWFFTTVHALHIIGGLPPLALVIRNSLQSRYNRFRHDGVRYCAMYWHFLDAVWLIMFAVMIWPAGG